MERLNNIEWINQRIAELIIERRTASEENQKYINGNLTWLYERKYTILKGGEINEQSQKTRT